METLKNLVTRFWAGLLAWLTPVAYEMAFSQTGAISIEAVIHAVRKQLGIDQSITDTALKSSLLGQLYVADWKYLMAAAGRAFRISYGTIGGGADLTPNPGITPNLDQPTCYIGVGTGLRLIPMEIEISAQCDDDDYEDEVEMLWYADTTQVVAEGATAVVAGVDMASDIAVQNLLDGGPDFPGRALATITGDITDPVVSQLLAYDVWEVKQLGAETNAGRPVQNFKQYKNFDYPTLLKGPCGIVGNIHGTVAPTYMGCVVVGVVPDDWFPTS